MVRLTPILILLLALAIGFIAWQSHMAGREKERRLNENAIHQERVKQLETEAALSEAKITALEKARKIYTDSAKIAQKASKQEIRAYKATIAKLKVKVLPQIDTSSDLSHLISMQDLVIAKQDSLLHATELAHSAEIVNLESQLRERGRQLMTKEAVNELLANRNSELEKDLKKVKRARGFWKWTSAALAGGILYMAIKE